MPIHPLTGKMVVPPRLPAGWTHLDGGTIRQVDIGENYYMLAKVYKCGHINPNVRTIGWIVVRENEHPIHHERLFEAIPTAIHELTADTKAFPHADLNNSFGLAVVAAQDFLMRCGFDMEDIDQVKV